MVDNKTEYILFLLKKIDNQEKQIEKFRKETEENANLIKELQAQKSKSPCFMCNFASNQDKYGKGDFFKLSKQSRKENQIYELFQHINFILNDMNLCFDNVNIIENTKNSYFKFSIKKKSSINERVSVETVLYWKDKLLISDDSYRLLVINLLLDLPSIHTIRFFRQQLNSSLKIFKLNDYSYFVDIKMLINIKVKLFIDSNVRDSQVLDCKESANIDETIIIKLSADGTLCGHINIINITFTIINDTKSCMTATGNNRLGILNCQENYDDLKVPFSHLVAITNQIEKDGIIHNDKRYSIEFKWGSDWMLEVELNGLKGPTSNHPCLVCHCEKKDFYNIDLHNQIMNDPKRRKDYLRSLDAQREHLLIKDSTARKGYKRESILQMNYDKFVKDMLHLKLNMNRVLVSALLENLCQLDKYDRKSPLLLNQSKHPNLTKWFLFLNETCKIQVRPIHSKEIMRTLRGEEINHLYENLKEGDLVKMFPKAREIDIVDMIWIDFWHIYQAVISNVLVPDKIAEYTYVWFKMFNSVYPASYITPYIHYFVGHLHHQVSLHGDINLYNEQGNYFIQ
jgi:hypothetical protein